MRTALVMVISSAIGTASAVAAQGDSETGFRLLWVTAGASSAGTIGGTGSSVTLSSGPGIEFGWILAPLDELSVEMSVGLTAHSVGTSGGTFEGIDGGTLWRVPISATAQYHPNVFARFDPYVGLGLVYNFASYRMSSSYEVLVSDVHFSQGLGIVAQVGVSYPIDIRWSANADLRFMGMTTTGTFTGLDSAPIAGLDFAIDPWVIGLGFRYRY
jgi:outer membrane protein